MTAKFLAAFGLLTLLSCASKESQREYITSKPIPTKVPTSTVTEVFQDLRQSNKFSTLSQNIRFDVGSTELSPSSRRALSQMATEIKNSVGSFEKIRIAGLSDSTGDSEKNLQISQARADNVRKYLISQGIDAEKLEAIGKGPATKSSETTPEQNARDRRVDFEIVE